MSSFTYILQQQIDREWQPRIQRADMQMKLCSSGKEIRDFLNDKRTLCTVGFVIRRYLQTAMPELLDQIVKKTGISYCDLTNNLNLPWDEEFIRVLSAELSRLSRRNKINISKNTWISYLSDTPVKMYKDTPFKVAFSLKMPIDITEDLLMACGQEPYCLRRPDHYIYYYCQSRPDSYDWEHAQILLNNYKIAIEKPVFTANDATSGMTKLLRANLQDLIRSTAINEIADTELLDYMLNNQQEFSGLTLTIRDDFLRMAEYLVVLYPTYTKAITAKDPKSGEISESLREVAVSVSESGSVRLGELVRSLFTTGGWLTTTIGNHTDPDSMQKKRTASSLKRREASSHIEYNRAIIDEVTDKPFLNSVQFFVDSYSHHLDAIERVYRKPSNPANVDRRDIILFTYFFIRRYPDLLADEEYYGKELDRLTDLTFRDSFIDRAMDIMMDQLYTLTTTEDDPVMQSEAYLDIFNSILRYFGMKEMYMPSIWDRFIYMSLFAEDPDFFTEAVLWNTISDETEEASDLSSSEQEDTGFPEASTAPLTQRAICPIQVFEVSHLPMQAPPLISDAYRPALLLRVRTRESIPVDSTCFIIGRKSIKLQMQQSYGFHTDDKSISRLHAAILYKKGKYYLADLSSLHASWLNGNPIAHNEIDISLGTPYCFTDTCQLRHNDEIRIGNELFTFIMS